MYNNMNSYNNNGYNNNNFNNNYLNNNFNNSFNNNSNFNNNSFNNNNNFTNNNFNNNRFNNNNNFNSNNFNNNNSFNNNNGYNNRALNPQIEYIADIIWAKQDFSKSDMIYNMLKQLVSMNNGDALYLLSRCFAGPCYIDEKFGFNFNEDIVIKSLDKSILYGSALGMFAARRFAGYTPPNHTYIHPPFKTERQIFETVLAYANSGSNFCKYLVANCIMYQDIIPMLNIDVSNPNALKEFLNWQLLALNFYDDAIKKGYTLCLINKDVLIEDIHELCKLLGFNGKKIVKKRKIV